MMMINCNKYIYTLCNYDADITKNLKYYRESSSVSGKPISSVVCKRKECTYSISRNEHIFFLSNCLTFSLKYGGKLR
jgi:hypothetical protein